MKRENDAAQSKLYFQALILFLVALGPRVLDLGVFVTPDEPRWMNRSIDFLRAVLEGDFGHTVHAIAPGLTPGGVPTKWLASLALLARYFVFRQGLDIPAQSAGLEGFLDWLPARPQNLMAILVYVRWPIALVSALGVVLIYLLARRLYGRRVAFLGGLLMALDPFYMAHSRLLHTDALATIFMTLSVLTFLLYLDGRRSYRWVIASGVAAGLSCSTKTGALFLAPLVGLWGVVDYTLEARESKRIEFRGILRLALIMAAWGLAAALTFVLLWPAMWVAPLDTLHNTFIRAGHLVEAGQDQFFLGRVVKDPGPGFYPLVLLFRATPLTLLGMAAGLVAYKRGAGRKQSLWLWSYVVLYVVFLSFSPKKNDRYILPLFPALDILAAVGLWNLFEVITSRFKLIATEGTEFTEVKAKSLRVLCGFILVLQAAFALPHHPYYLTWFNPALGGMRAASRLLLVGWGEGLEQAAAYLNEQEEGRAGRVLAWYAALGFSTMFQGECRELSPGRHPASDVWPWYQADYVVFYVNQVQRNLPDDKMVAFFRARQPEYAVRLKGQDYAWIYRVPDNAPMEVWPFQHPLAADFGGVVRLLGYEAEEPREDESGKLSLPLTLYWQNVGKLDANYRLYLKVVNGVYHVWGAQEGYPLWDGFMTSEWPPGAVIRDERQIDILPGTPPGAYGVTVEWLDPYSGRTLPSGENLVLGPFDLPLHRTSALDVEHQLEVNLGDRIRLLGYNIESGFRPGDGLHLTLFWQAVSEIDEDYTVFVHLVDGPGHLWGQKDNQPVDGFYPTTKWVSGQFVRDQYDLLISPDAPPGQYRIEVGMYRAHSGERLAVLNEDGLAVGDKVILPALEVVNQ